jgi:PAS domain S-box-containing protein
MLWMFLEAYLSESGRYRQQARAILGGVAVIYLTAIIEVAGLEPYPDLLYNATMAGSTVLSVTFLWALFYADFLEVTPVARRVLLEDIDDAAVVLDHQDRLVYANRAAHELFDTDPAYVGMPADDVFSVVRDQKLNQLTGMANGQTELVITPNGEKRYFSVTASTVGDDERRRAFVLHEITAEKEYRQRIEEQRDSLDLLNQVLRHDIRNDLQLILGYTEVVADRTADDVSQRHLETVRESAEHAVELTKVAREMAAVMLSAEQELEPISIRMVVLSEVEQVREAYPDATIITASEIQQVSVRADEMLGSVFRNLLKNAVQHNDKPIPTVTVSSKTQDDRISIRVADNGPGISDDAKENIFGKGEKGLDSEGTGIGLYLVKSLVESYGGDVWVEDRKAGGVIDTETPADTPSEGAAFVVELPTVREEHST